MDVSLFQPPPPDMEVGVVFALFALAIGTAAVLFMGLVFVEALILRWICWESLNTALCDSFKVNLVTSVFFQ